MADATEILTADEIAVASATGTAWGEQEVELYEDQIRLPSEWTLGTWQGNAFRFIERTGDAERDDARADAFERVLDAAARDVWNAAYGL